LNPCCRLERVDSRPPEDRGALGSRRRNRTCLHRLTAGRPHRDGSTGMFFAKFGGARRNRTDDILLAKQALSLLSYGPEMVHKDGIEPPTRAPSTRRSTSELPVRVGAAGGKSNPSSPRWQRGALPLSYGREIGGQGPSRTATDYAGRLQRLGLANAQPARDGFRERDSNTRCVVMSRVRRLVTAPSSRVEGARL
jgi:hypothetical protein